MKDKSLMVCALAVLAALALPMSASAQEPAADAPVQTGMGRHFAATDYTGGKVFIVSAEGKVEWEYESGTCNDLWVLPNGNLLFNTGRGVREVNRAKETVFNYDSNGEIFACQRLANGNTFIGECTNGRLIEVEPSGKIAFELRLVPEGTDAGHIFMRNARKLQNGNYLVAHSGQEVVREYDPQGKVVMEIPAPGGPHSAVRTPEGHTIISCGDMHKEAMIFEVDRDGKTVWKITHDELPGIPLKFMSGFHRLPNGNTVMTNWVGHGEFGKAPHLIEVTPDKKVVWTFQDHKTMKTLSSVQVLDVPGDAIKGDIIH